ncbi:MAG TPA: PASTA domain-containing protein [Acidimicrobiales bacterium]|nr:PASTA domain-containing protein [Acidimicrobiales bacterium]
MTSTRIVEHLGRVLGGRYRLLAPIGTGASAHVFLADDVKLRRRVAVKLLHPALADDGAFLRRFRAEARAAAALNHPNIMAVYDWGEEADGPYLVCEFLGGGSLRAILDRGTRLTPSQALAVGLEAARALDYACRRGLVHRDIKPANLLFDEEGRLRIADFGLARALAEASWTEPAGAVLGTARYASPEQVKGSPLDGRSDVYSLAVLLFEAVTGRVPFAADTTVGTLLGRLDRPIPADPALGPLGPIVARAGRPDPAERLDAMALGAALQAAASELPAPEPLPLAGLAFLDETLAHLDRDPTDMGHVPSSPGSDARAPTTPVAVAAPPPADDTVSLAPVLTGPGPAPVAPAPTHTLELSPAGRRRRRRWPIVLLVVLVLAAAGAAGAWALVQARVPSHPVPDTVNRPEAEAVAALQALEFEVRIQRAFVNGTAAGQVTAQDPAANTKLKEGRTVTLTVSQGPVPVPVPDLSGLDRNAAVQAIQKGGLAMGKVTSRHDEEAPEGRVLDWSPKGGMAPTGSAVDLTLSAGPSPRLVPDLKGQSYEAAAAALGRQGLKAARADDYSDTVPQGQVIGTNPQAGASVERGSTVSVVVSRGQPEVPALRGLSVADATAKLAAADLRLGNVYGPPGGRVFHTIPNAGTKVKAGTTVTLFIL